IGDEMPGRYADSRHYLAQKIPDLVGAWLSDKNGEAQRPSGVMIEDNRQPPAKRPTLRQGERKPPGPEACRRGHGGEIHVPNVVGILGGNLMNRCDRLDSAG